LKGSSVEFHDEKGTLGVFLGVEESIK
jgi:hypothetical protein